MPFPIKFFGIAVASAALGATLLPAGTLYGASGEEVIKARVNFMKDEIEAHWKPLAAYASKGKGSLADVQKNAEAMEKLAPKIAGHFPKDTGRGHFPDKKTRALPVIWTKWTEFEKDAQRLADQSAKLASLAKAGDQDAVVQLIGKAGKYSKTKLGCAECHKTFRGDRVK